jgi:TPR repeat protein
MSVWIVSLFTACINVGCVFVPLPPGKNVYITENDIRALLYNDASQDEVIKILDRPARQYESDISYRACQKGAGELTLILLYPLVGYEVYRDETECYELILHFDNNRLLTGYDKLPFDTPFSDNFKTPDGKALPTIRVMAEKGFPESQWRLYYEYGQKPEDILWLCRSADNGYAKAQFHVGDLYWNASNIQGNKSKAFVWYRLAATGDRQQGLLSDQDTQILAALAINDAEKVLTPEQLAEAEALYAEWHSGLCELEIISENNED